MNLTPDQLVAVRNGDVIRFAEDGIECVVLRADVFERVKDILTDASDWSRAESCGLLARSAEGNGWSEPEMDAYDSYEQEIQKRCR